MQGLANLPTSCARSWYSALAICTRGSCGSSAGRPPLRGEDATEHPPKAGQGTTDNGFGLLFNWNRLGDGEHTVVAYVDGVEWQRATVRVTTLGAEILRGAEGSVWWRTFRVPARR